jgi:hypothetical protein
VRSGDRHSLDVERLAAFSAAFSGAVIDSDDDR